MPTTPTRQRPTQAASRRRRAGLALAAALFLGFPSAAPAMHPEDAAAEDLRVLRDDIDDGDAVSAETTLRALLEERPEDADVLNLLGYATRKQGRWKTARRYYERALALEPAHRGALEYMGELELETGDRAAAEALLARLRAACQNGCEELRDLEAAFARR